MGAFVAGEPESIRRFAWTGFLGQAGVSMGLAALVRSKFPEPGKATKTDGLNLALDSIPSAAKSR